ncbi:TLC domain-containing protein [Amylostereum chailletii]|nr:TLC domain-containing protein [Amylostereum chailletii]
MPQTPVDTPRSSPVPVDRRTPVTMPDSIPKSEGFWRDIVTARWVVVPASSFRMLLFVVVLHFQWVFLTPLFFSSPPRSPFAPLLFISYPTPSPTGDPNDPRFRKGWLDIAFVAYYIVFWSFIRQVITIHLLRPVARYFKLRTEAKLDRFGEQGYAMIYFAFFGAWGLRIMSQHPTWWYYTKAFWIDYPHWQMKPELKRYYLMQAAYWCQQLVVLVLGLEKPRKDYNELIAHHFVTLWLVGWSYGTNMTLIGNAVYASMDIPDVFLAFSKLLNYIRWDRTKVVTFTIFIGIWTYFRHYLNLVMLWSVYKEFDLIPENSKRWAPEDGVWMVGWMKWQIFTPILFLQFLNLFWYCLMLRILGRAIFDSATGDERSDDEDEGEDDSQEKKDE